MASPIHNNTKWHNYLINNCQSYNELQQEQHEGWQSAALTSWYNNRRNNNNNNNKIVLHFYTGIGVTPTELSVTLQPVLDETQANKIKTIKHPNNNNWANTLQRMNNITGGGGTYKAGGLKKRALGAREFRTDKYGRRTE
eukprot:Tbor_TRINITY_DN5654_c2_g1::TRINITY_DN5654_c2_g1_i14::g.9359::m.9359